MPRTAALIAAIALSMYGSSADPQAAAPPTGQSPPTGQPAQDVAANSDEALTNAVYSALDADPHHYFRHVTVRVDKGVANLSGYVDSGAAINRARKIASKITGVTRVETNHLQVDTQRRR